MNLPVDQDPKPKVGNVYLYDERTFIKIRVIEKDKDKTVRYDHWNGEEWSSYGSDDMESFIKKRLIYVQLAPEENPDMVMKSYLDKSINYQYENQEQQTSDSRGVATVNKELLQSYVTEMNHKRNELKLMEAALEQRRHEIGNYIYDLKEKIEKLQKVLYTIELYLGVHEQVVQIREGIPAGKEELIHFRQQILYMDEEIAVWYYNQPDADSERKEQGFDFQDINKFDDWIRDNYKNVIPEEKGIVIIRPRHHDKTYAVGEGSWYTNAIYNVENKRTYILIRNGENLYRIWADIKIEGKLFPSQGEIQEMQNQEDTYDSPGFGPGQWSRKRYSEDDIRKVIEEYNFHTLVLQGILDRSDVLHPYPHKVDLFKPSTYEGAVKLIYDCDAVLVSRKDWSNFRKEINDKIVRGTRMIIYKTDWWRKEDSRTNHYCGHPANGLYWCETVTPEDGWHTKRFYFLFLPGDTVGKWVDGKDGYNYWKYVPRERRERIYMYSDEVLNYDDITIEDIDFYVNDRANRSYYFEMIPILFRMKKQKLEEAGQEENFKKFMVSQFADKDITKYLDEAITWWKFKVIYKRPLIKEDAKAVRMIKGKIKRMLEEEKKCQTKKNCTTK